MPCIVPYCTSKGKSTFGVPKNNDLLDLWKLRLGIDLKPYSRVCSNHFKHNDIINTWESGQGFSKYIINLKRVRLRKGAVPENNISNLNINNTFKDNVTPELINTALTGKIQDNLKQNCVLLEHCYSKNHPRAAGASITSSTSLDTSDKSNVNSTLSPTSEDTQLQTEVQQVTNTLYKSLLKNSSLLSIPSTWSTDVCFHPKYDRVVTFLKLGPFRDNFVRFIEKQVILTKDFSVFIHVNGKEISTTDIGLPLNYKPENIEDLENIINLLESAKVCTGSVSSNKCVNIKSTFGSKYMESCGQWRHSKCSMVLSTNSESRICLWCKRLKYCIQKRIYRSKKECLPKKKKMSKKLESRKAANKNKNQD